MGKIKGYDSGTGALSSTISFASMLFLKEKVHYSNMSASHILFQVLGRVASKIAFCTRKSARPLKVEAVLGRRSRDEER